jgi:hypothetical protein
MPRRRSPLLHDVTELAWAVLLIDVIVLLTGALVAAYAGRPAMLLAAAFALVVTVTMAALAAVNLLLIAVLRPRDCRGRAEGLSRSTSP